MPKTCSWLRITTTKLGTDIFTVDNKDTRKMSIEVILTTFVLIFKSYFPTETVRTADVFPASRCLRYQVDGEFAPWFWFFPLTCIFLLAEVPYQMKKINFTNFLRILLPTFFPNTSMVSFCSNINLSWSFSLFNFPSNLSCKSDVSISDAFSASLATETNIKVKITFYLSYYEIIIKQKKLYYKRWTNPTLNKLSFEPLTYDLNGCKSRVNRHPYLWFLPKQFSDTLFTFFLFLFFLTLYLAVAVQLSMEWMPVKKRKRRLKFENKHLSPFYC